MDTHNFTAQIYCPLLNYLALGGLGNIWRVQWFSHTPPVTPPTHTYTHTHTRITLSVMLYVFVNGAVVYVTLITSFRELSLYFNTVCLFLHWITVHKSGTTIKWLCLPVCYSKTPEKLRSTLSQMCICSSPSLLHKSDGCLWLFTDSTGRTELSAGVPTAIGNPKRIWNSELWFHSVQTLAREKSEKERSGFDCWVVTSTG